MRPRVNTARQLISSKDIATSAVTHQPRSFGFQKAKSSEARIVFTFVTANAPYPIYHGLGKTPTGVIPIAHGSAVIYTDVPLVADKRTVVVYSNTARTTAEIIVR